MFRIFRSKLLVSVACMIPIGFLSSSEAPKSIFQTLERPLVVYAHNAPNSYFQHLSRFDPNNNVIVELPETDDVMSADVWVFFVSSGDEVKNLPKFVKRVFLRPEARFDPERSTTGYAEFTIDDGVLKAAAIHVIGNYSTDLKLSDPIFPK